MQYTVTIVMPNINQLHKEAVYHKVEGGELRFVKKQTFQATQQDWYIHLADKRCRTTSEAICQIFRKNGVVKCEFGGIYVSSKSPRYLFISCSTKFSCSFDSAKRSFYRSFNAIFGKVCTAASEEVVLHLVKTKCLPILLYAL